MATANELVDSALRGLGVTSPDSTQQAQGILALNRMLGVWNAQMGPIFSETLDSLTWTTAQASRTIGSSGDFNTARPQKILRAQIRDSQSQDHDLIVISHQAYQAIEDKTQTSTLPTHLAYNPTFSSSLGTLFMWPVPDGSQAFRLTSLKPLADLVGASTVTLPPGYEEAIIMNLRIRLAPEYGVDVDAGTVAAAQDAKAALIQANDFPEEVWPDLMAPGIFRGVGNFNILTDT